MAHYRPLLPLAGFALFAAFWYAVALSGVFAPGQLARLDQAVATVGDRLANAELWRDIQLSVLRVLTGVAVLWVPFDLRLKEAVPGAVEIDKAGNYDNAGVVDGWIANNGWYDKNEDTVRKLIRGWLATNAAFRKDERGSLEKVFKSAYDAQAKLSALQHQTEFQSDFTNKEWRAMYESGEILDRVGHAEKAYVELGGVPQYVEPSTFFDTSLFIDEAKGAE